jgi:hypothetical protein
MSIAQDFKATWIWFIHHKIGELIASEGININVANANRLGGITNGPFRCWGVTTGDPTHDV